MLLEFLEEKGIDAPFSCREGNCSACACVVLEGEVKLKRNEVLDPEDLADGIRLVCSHCPRARSCGSPTTGSDSSPVPRSAFSRPEIQRRADMTDNEQIERLIRNWAAAVHRGDMEAVVAGHAPDIVMFDVPPPDQGVRGIEAYRATWPWPCCS